MILEVGEMKLADLEEGTIITLQISNEINKMSMDAVIKKNLKENVSIIELLISMKQRLVFNNVKIDVRCSAEDGLPYVWHDVQVLNVKSEYVLQVKGNAVKYNRRDCFRVPVACRARMKRLGGGGEDVVIKDVSLSGFAISDRGKQLKIELGEIIEVTFEDAGHSLHLKGRAIRTEEHENMIVYGFELMNLCKDLSSYISVMQRRKREAEKRQH